MSENENQNKEKPVKKETAKPAQPAAGKRKGSGAGASFTVEKDRPRGPVAMARLEKNYNDKIVPQLMKDLNLKNKMQVPRLKKVVINACTRDALANPKVIDSMVEELALITGQKPVVTRAKKSIAAFKLREGQALGAMVTLRKARMYEFLDRFINIMLPRVRDFRGLNPKSFDGRGNYSMGLKEQIVFTEINYDKIDKIRGMNITITTNAKNNDHARSLLFSIGMPFKK